MARRIKRFLVFMFFSLFFTLFTKKFQSTDSTPKGKAVASAENSKASLGKKMSSIIGVNSAMAVECSCEDGEWYCGGGAGGGAGGGSLIILK